MLIQLPFRKLLIELGRGALRKGAKSFQLACILPQSTVFVQVQSGAHWLRLIVGSAGGMSRMVRWPRKKPDQKNKRRSRRSRSRGLIDRDVSGATPASVGNADSRLANRRSDRADL